MADIDGKQPIRSLDSLGNDLAVKIGDGTETVSVTASNELVVLDTNSAATLTSLQLIDDTVYTDGTGTPSKGIAIMGSDGTNPQFVAVDASGNLQVDIVSGASAGVQYNTNNAYADGNTGTLALTIRDDALSTLTEADGDFSALRVDSNGALWVNLVETSFTVTATDLDIRDLTSASDSVEVLQTTHDDLNANANIQVNNTDVSNSNPVPVSRTTAANSELNPIYVQTVTGAVSGTEIHNYDTSSGVAAAASDTHSYVVTSTKTLLLQQFTASASGAMKVTLQATSTVGPATTTYGVWFTSASHPYVDVTFAKPIELADPAAADTMTVELVRKNIDTASMDVYSTLIGAEV